MLKTRKLQLEFKDGTTTIKLFFNPAKEDNKHKNLLGFADVSIWTEGVKLPESRNGLQLIVGKEENYFIVEPRQASYKKGDEVINGKKWYQIKQAVKDDLTDRIIKALSKDI